VSVRSDTLPNGLTVISAAMAELETASVGVWVDAGARHESAEVNGVAHMLEHMAFKGTERRSALDIAEEIEAVGGHLNAHTSREHTAYYARVLKEDVALAVDILADILQHSVFDEEELAREREVVVQEIHQASDTPDDIVFDHLQEIAFPGQSLGRPILGTAELVKGFRRETLAGYMAEHYRAPRMVLAAAGRVEHEELVSLARGAFAEVGPDSREKPEAGRYRGGDYREQRDLEQVHLTFGFQGVAFEDPDFYPLQVLSTVLGGGMSSRLFQEVREKRGLAYSVFAFSASYVDSGLFGIYAGCGENQVEELVPVICDVVGEVARDTNDSETSRARAQLKAGLMMSLESSASRCEQLGRQMQVYGRPIPPAEMIERIDAVDAAAVRAAAARVAGSHALSLAVIGPIARLESYDRVAARFG
jgi:predicted Zn-dependent peptidase